MAPVAWVSHDTLSMSALAGTRSMSTLVGTLSMTAMVGWDTHVVGTHNPCQPLVGTHAGYNTGQMTFYNKHPPQLIDKWSNCHNNRRTTGLTTSKTSITAQVGVFYTQRNFFEFLLNKTGIRLYLPFSNCFRAKQTSVWFQINRKLVYTIWFQFDLMWFGKYFSACKHNNLQGSTRPNWNNKYFSGKDLFLCKKDSLAGLQSV